MQLGIDISLASVFILFWAAVAWATQETKSKKRLQAKLDEVKAYFEKARTADIYYYDIVPVDKEDLRGFAVVKLSYVDCIPFKVEIKRFLDDDLDFCLKEAQELCQILQQD